MRRVAHFLISASLILTFSGVFASMAGAADFVMTGAWKYQNNAGRVLSVPGGNGAGANPAKGVTKALLLTMYTDASLGDAHRDHNLVFNK